MTPISGWGDDDVDASPKGSGGLGFRAASGSPSSGLPRGPEGSGQDKFLACKLEAEEKRTSAEAAERAAAAAATAGDVAVAETWREAAAKLRKEADMLDLGVTVEEAAAAAAGPVPPPPLEQVRSIASLKAQGSVTAMRRQLSTPSSSMVAGFGKTQPSSMAGDKKHSRSTTNVGMARGSGYGQKIRRKAASDSESEEESSSDDDDDDEDNDDEEEEEEEEEEGCGSASDMGCGSGDSGDESGADGEGSDQHRPRRLSQHARGMGETCRNGACRPMPKRLSDGIGDSGGEETGGEDVGEEEEDEEEHCQGFSDEEEDEDDNDGSYYDDRDLKRTASWQSGASKSNAAGVKAVAKCHTFDFRTVAAAGAVQNVGADVLSPPGIRAQTPGTPSSPSLPRSSTPSHHRPPGGGGFAASPLPSRAGTPASPGAKKNPSASSSSRPSEVVRGRAVLSAGGPSSGGTAPLLYLSSGGITAVPSALPTTQSAAVLVSMPPSPFPARPGSPLAGRTKSPDTLLRRATSLMALARESTLASPPQQQAASAHTGRVSTTTRGGQPARGSPLARDEEAARKASTSRGALYGASSAGASSPAVKMTTGGSGQSR